MSESRLRGLLKRWATLRGVAVKVRGECGWIHVHVMRSGVQSGFRWVSATLEASDVAGWSPVDYGRLLGELARASGLNSVDVTERVRHGEVDDHD